MRGLHLSISFTQTYQFINKLRRKDFLNRVLKKDAVKGYSRRHQHTDSNPVS